MTSWQPGPVAEWGPRTAWHDEVMNSAGFSPPQENTGKPSDLTPEVASAVEKCMPYYKELAALRILPE